MHTLDAPNFFSDLTCRIQNVAAVLGVTVIVDVEERAWFRLDGPTFDSLLFELACSLIHAAPPGAVLSFVTQFEPESKNASQAETGSPSAEAGRFLVQIICPSLASVDYDGLALPLAAFLRSQKGDIQIQFSESKCSFILDLPYGWKSSMQAPKTQYKVLIVEDEPEFLEILKTILESEGFGVITASDGFSALLNLERHAPDVILTDIVLPNMNGIDLISRVSAWKSDLPVIVLTGFPETLTHLPAHVRCKVLQKPLHPQDLFTALAEVLRFVRK